jgi:hypothetical protein
LLSVIGCVLGFGYLAISLSDAGFFSGLVAAPYEKDVLNYARQRLAADFQFVPTGGPKVLHYEARRNSYRYVVGFPGHDAGRREQTELLMCLGVTEFNNGTIILVDWHRYMSNILRDSLQDEIDNCTNAT